MFLVLHLCYLCLVLHWFYVYNRFILSKNANVRKILVTVRKGDLLAKNEKLQKILVTVT